MIENIGWEAGNKRSSPIYKRDSEDGSFIIDEEGHFIIHSDFSSALNKIRISKAATYFPWLSEGQTPHSDSENWSIHIKEILQDKDYTIDPKRYCKKVTDLKNQLLKKTHVALGEIVDFLPERTSSNNKKIKIIPSKAYKYVEIQNMSYGDYTFNELKGWELPSRARHFAEEGDFYFGSIWGSVSKWCYIGSGIDDIVMTNGCHRCRIKEGKEEFLLDLLAYANSEGWSAQLRSLSRGSDGLAEVCIDDAKSVIIPIISEKKIRDELQSFVQNLKESKVTINSTVAILINQKKWDLDEPQKRPSHIVLV